MYNNYDINYDSDSDNNIISNWFRKIDILDSIWENISYCNNISFNDIILYRTLDSSIDNGLEKCLDWEAISSRDDITTDIIECYHNYKLDDYG